MSNNSSSLRKLLVSYLPFLFPSSTAVEFLRSSSSESINRRSPDWQWASFTETLTTLFAKSSPERKCFSASLLPIFSSFWVVCPERSASYLYDGFKEEWWKKVSANIMLKLSKFTNLYMSLFPTAAFYPHRI